MGRNVLSVHVGVYPAISQAGRDGKVGGGGSGVVGKYSSPVNIGRCFVFMI